MSELAKASGLTREALYNVESINLNDNGAASPAILCGWRDVFSQEVEEFS